MTREEFRNYVEFLRSQNEISYDIYSGLIDGIDTLEQEPCEDSIGREDAIEAVCGLCDKSTGIFEENPHIDAVREALENLPSVKPQDKDRAIEALEREAFTMVPSAQPEIVRCKDCKYWRKRKYAKETKRYIPFCGFNAIYTKSDDFCSRAERREE